MILYCLVRILEIFKTFLNSLVESTKVFDMILLQVWVEATSKLLIIVDSVVVADRFIY